MRVNTTKALIVGLSVAAAGLLSACNAELAAAGGPSATSAPPAVSTSASVDEPEPSSAPEPSSGPEDGGSGAGTGQESDPPIGEGCGPVDGTNGTVDVIPEDTAAGTVGCTEAINVITKYYEDSPTQGEGTAYALTVDGWYCLTDGGAQGSGAVGCEKDGLAFHTQA